LQEPGPVGSDDRHHEVRKHGRTLNDFGARRNPGVGLERRNTSR
jgi:hypothetical protein